MLVSFDKQTLLAALNPAAGIAPQKKVLAAVDGLLFEDPEVRPSRLIGLQYFAETEETAAVSVEEQLERTDLIRALLDLEGVLHAHKDETPESYKTFSSFTRWRADHQNPEPAEAYRALRRFRAGDIASSLWKQYHEEPMPGERQKRPQLSIDALENWLGENNIRVRRNLITHRMEVDGIPDGDIDEEQIASQGAAYIHDKVKKEFSCTVQEVGSDLQIIAGRNSFNPVLEKLEAAEPWDRRDRICDFNEILGIQDDELSRTLVYKFLLQAYCLQSNTLKMPFAPEGVLVLVGPQGIGKTTVFRALALDPKLFAEGVTLDGSDKDSQIRATSCWICELGELDGTIRKSDAAFLKSFMLKDSDSIRAPYAAADDVNRRRTSFCGTCNEAKFLVDPTGNRRFWTIPVQNIDLKKLRFDFDVLQLWQEIAEQVKAGSANNPNFVQECFRLTPNEQKQLNERNGSFEKPLPGEDEIRDLIARADIEPNLLEWRYTTLTEFIKEHELRIPVNKLRPAIERIALSDDRIRHSSRCPGTDKQGRYVRLPMFKSRSTSATAAIEEKLKNG